MEYTPYFRLIQTSLTHCNEFVKNFSKINYYGGYEVYINEITLKLRNIFLGNGFTSEDCDELRKINLLLMFNTNLSYKYDLKEDFQICHLLNNFPQLTKCLYVNIMWQLKLQKYYYEALSYSPSWFIMPFLDETVDSLRFSKSFDVIHQVKDIVEAIYTNICRTDYRSIKFVDVNDKKIMLESLLITITSLLRYYNTPSTEEAITNSKIKTKEYNGHSLNCQLLLILSCFKMFLKKPAFEIDEKFHIYKINQDKEPDANNYSVNKYSSAVDETLTQINVILLNTLQNSVLNITLNDFLYWVEIDMEDDLIEDEDLKRDNLQKLIGEQAYELVDMIKNNLCFEHNVVDQLSTISLKPKTLQEIAKDASVGTVLDKIEKSPSKIVWIEELLSRTDTLYFNDECLQTIIDNIDILKVEHLMKMLKDHQNYDVNDEDEVQMNEIFLKGGSKLKFNEMKEFIDELVTTFGTDYCLSFDPELFREQEINNYLNKITEENIEEPTMWKLILKNPQLFFEKLLEDIDSQDETQISTILKVIFTTCPVSNNFIKKIILSDTESNEINEKSSRHVLLSGLFKFQIVDRKEFIKDILMNNFSRALSANVFTPNLLMFLKTLKHISNQLKINDLLPPLMIQLAQILDKYRWDLMTYSGLREVVVDTTIAIIQELIKTVLINGSKNDKEWIKNKISSLKSMTKFYFQRLSLEKGEAIVPFDVFLHPQDFANIPKIKITSFLCETIVRCTSKESRKLMNNDVLQNFYTEALSLVSIIVKKANQNLSPLQCLRKCVTDYVKILSDVIIPSAKAKNQEEALLKDIINLMKKLPPSLHDDLTILFLDTIKELNIDENFMNLISEIDDCELKRILSEQSNVI